jgi:hypothetical protein
LKCQIKGRYRVSIRGIEDFGVFSQVAGDDALIEHGWFSFLFDYFVDFLWIQAKVTTVNRSLLSM